MFVTKDMCDVRQVEIARAVRLCKTTVQPVFIKVPRTRVSKNTCIHMFAPIM